MSTTPQERVLHAIEYALEERGYEMSRQDSFSNQGWLQALAPGALGSDHAAFYDFQDNRCSFTAVTEGGRISTDNRLGPKYSYAFTDEELKMAVAAVVEHLTQRAK